MFPMWLSETENNVSLAAAGTYLAIYPLVWGCGQLLMGRASDRYGRKPFLVLGGLFNGFSLLVAIALPPNRTGHHEPLALALLWVCASSLLGIGTAMMYPTMQAAAADETQPAYRAFGMGIYRFCRDSGYVVGVVLVTEIIVWFDSLRILFMVVSGALFTVATLNALVYTEPVHQSGGH